MDKIPVKGVQFLLGNDIAGNVISNLPIVMNKPKLIDDTDRFKDEIPNVFPACVVTRAMAKCPQTNTVDVLSSHNNIIDNVNVDATTNAEVTNKESVCNATDEIDQYSLVNDFFFLIYN